MDNEKIRNLLKITNFPPRQNLRGMFQLFQQQNEGLVICFLDAEEARWEIIKQGSMSAYDHIREEFRLFFDQVDPKGYICRVGNAEFLSF